MSDQNAPYPVVAKNVEERSGKEIKRVLRWHRDVSEVNESEKTMKTLPRRNHFANRDRNAVVDRTKRSEKYFWILSLVPGCTTIKF